MASFIKEIIKKTFAALGYEITRRQSRATSTDDSSSATLLMFNNFTNLSQIYEHVLNLADRDHPILTDDVRPKLLTRLLGTPPSEAYCIVQALAKTRSIDGDVCEFGVAQGETSALIANEIARSNKSLHLFDSFEGLPKPSDKDKLKDDIFSLGIMDAYTGTMAYPIDLVQARLAAISFPSERRIIHKGFIEKVIQEDKHLPKLVSFAYVDFDFYEPIKVTLEFLHPITPTGAIILVDDYDYFSSGAKAAVDEFIDDKNSSKHIYDCILPDTQYGRFIILTKRDS